MRLALAGDKQAYAKVLHETSRFIRPFLAKRLSQSNEVDDLLQEILLSPHKARHTYDGERPYKPWVFPLLNSDCLIICAPIMPTICTMQLTYLRWKII